jgi:hypothetical protein
MKVKWLAPRMLHARGSGLTHLLLEHKNTTFGPFCEDLWWYEEWKKDPDPEFCKWCLEAERWLRLVEGEPLDVLKRIPGYHPTVRKHELEDSR